MIEDLKRQHDLLLEQMQSCQFKLTSVEEKGLLEISKGYFGYLITKGLWFKLRIWISIEENNIIKCKLILTENCLFKANALLIIEQVLSNFQTAQQ